MKLSSVLWGSLLSVLMCACSMSSSSNGNEGDDPAEMAKEKIQTGALVIDVRSPEEFSLGHIDGALNIPHDEISTRAQELGSNPLRQIVVYCRSGRRAGLALSSLHQLGFENVINAGGFSLLSEVMTEPH